MITRMLLAAAFAVFLAMPARAENQLIWTITAGDWTGGAYQSESGRFSHCSVSASYRSGTVLALTINADYQFLIVLGNASWQLPTGSRYDVVLSIDGRNLGRYNGETFNNSYLSITLGNDADAYQRLRKGREMKVAAARQNLFFDLTGTAQALSTVLACVERANSLASPSNPFAAPGQREASTNPFADNNTSSASSEQELVQGLLLASGFSDIQFTDPDGTGFSEAGYTWIADDYAGALYVYDTPNADLDQVVNTLLGGIATECTAGFASKPLPLEYIRRFRLKQFTAACRVSSVDQFFYAGTAVTDGTVVILIYNGNPTTASGLDEINASMTKALRILLPQ